MKEREFPYYIVRFKLKKAGDKTVAAHEFPYYIVRFKQTISVLSAKWKKSFHTT